MKSPELTKEVESKIREILPSSPTISENPGIPDGLLVNFSEHSKEEICILLDKEEKWF